MGPQDNEAATCECSWVHLSAAGLHASHQQWCTAELGVHLMRTDGSAFA